MISAFSQMYYIAGAMLECDEWQCSPQSAFFQSFSMLLTGDYGLTWNDWQNNDTLTLISFVFAMVMGILLLNILIAVVSNVFTKVNDDSEEAFWSNRFKSIVDKHSIISFFCPSSSMYIDSDKQSDSSFRRSFKHYDQDFMKSIKGKDNVESFFKWWFYSWKTKQPHLSQRLRYFYSHASIFEILFPEKVFHNIVFGLKYNGEVRGAKKILAMVLSFIHFILGLPVCIGILILGVVSFGKYWPRELKIFFFFGPVEKK